MATSATAYNLAEAEARSVVVHNNIEGQRERNGGRSGPVFLDRLAEISTGGLCMKCLHSEDTLAVELFHSLKTGAAKAEDKFVHLEVPANLCECCIYRLRDGDCCGVRSMVGCVAGRLAYWCGWADTSVLKAHVAIPRTVLDAAVRQYNAVSDRPDLPTRAAEMIYASDKTTVRWAQMADHLPDEQMKARFVSNSFRLLTHIVRSVVFNAPQVDFLVRPSSLPQCEEGSPGSGPPAPPGAPTGEEAVTPPADPTPSWDFDKDFGAPLVGYEFEVPSELLESGVLTMPDGKTVLRLKDIESLHPREQKKQFAEVEQQLLRAAHTSEGRVIYGEEGSVCELRLRPQAVRIAPGRDDAPVHIAAPSFGNAVAAAAHRHFKATPHLDAEVRGALDQIGKVIASTLRERVKTARAGKVSGKRCKDGSFRPGVQANEHSASINEALSRFELALTETLSAKWTSGRKDKALMQLILEMDTRPHNGGKLSKPVVTVKANESLTKRKPRLIISSGDAGCTRQMAGPGVLEALTFGLPEFESRSVKHTSPAGLPDRFEALLLDRANPSRWFCMSNDYGAFDGSIRLAVRKSVENQILNVAYEVVAEWAKPHKDLAQSERELIERKIKGFLLEISSTDMIRESGDRGTSVLNFWTNYAVFLYTSWRWITVGIRRENRLKISAARWAERVLSGLTKADRQLENVGEGDDNWPWYREDFVFGDAPPSQAVAVQFVRSLVEYALELGFNLEPQDHIGRVDTVGEDVTDERIASTLQPLVGGRHEFVSRVFRFSRNADGGVETIAFAKPRKTLDSLCVSFSLPSARCDKQAMLFYKALSLSSNHLDCYPMCRLLLAIAGAARRESRSPMLREEFEREAAWRAHEFRAFTGTVESFAAQVRRMSEALAHSGSRASAQCAALDHELGEGASERIMQCADACEGASLRAALDALARLRMHF